MSYPHRLFVTNTIYFAFLGAITSSSPLSFVLFLPPRVFDSSPSSCSGVDSSVSFSIFTFPSCKLRALARVKNGLLSISSSSSSSISSISSMSSSSATAPLYLRLPPRSSLCLCPFLSPSSSSSSSSSSASPFAFLACLKYFSAYLQNSLSSAPSGLCRSCASPTYQNSSSLASSSYSMRNKCSRASPSTRRAFRR